MACPNLKKVHTLLVPSGVVSLRLAAQYSEMNGATVVE